MSGRIFDPVAQVLQSGCRLPRNPLVGKQDGCPAIGIAIFAQTAGSRESHMRTRNENLPVNESSQQFVPRGYRRSRVDVEGNADLRMFQLDALGMNDVTPEQYPLAFRAEFITGMSWRMPGKWNNLDSFPDFIRAAECVPPPRLDIGRGDGLGALKELLRFLRCLGGDFR